MDPEQPRDEGGRYAERLRKVGALIQDYEIPGVDHGYDMDDAVQARATYALIARPREMSLQHGV